MRPRHRSILVAAVLAGAALAFLGMRHPAEPSPSAGAADTAQSGQASSPSQPSSPRGKLGLPGSARGAGAEDAADQEMAADDMEQADGATQIGEDYEENPIGDVLSDALSDDAALSNFMYFYKRPLKDEATREQYEKMLSDKAMFAETSHDILYPEERTEDLRGNVKRLMKIDYLRAALEWEDNPERKALLDTIESTILADNLPAGMGEDMKLSLAGNKMELYALLYDHARDRAVSVVDRSRGTRLEGLIAHIAESIETRRQKERESDAVVTL